MSTRAIFGTILAILLFAGGLASFSNLWETLDAGEIMVVQSPIDGDLTVYTDPGLKPQMFGTVQKFPRQGYYSFDPEQGGQPRSMRFNDGGHGSLSGSVVWEMPLSHEEILKIYRQFRTPEALQQRAIAKMVDTAIYLTGPLMSSTESSGERRAELVQYINDQAESGPYVTRSHTVTTKDEATGQSQQMVHTEIVLDKNGAPKRQQGSILAEYGISLQPVSIAKLDYDNIVEQQIAERQKSTTQVILAQAAARRAEQDKLTIEAQGAAKAAETKWAQEAIKAQMVTQAEQQKQVAELEAQQKLEVARLAAQEAEQYKKEQVLRGEGEAARKKLVMEADGALTQKLETYERVQGKWAEAIANYRGAWTPFVQNGATGKDGGTSGGGAQALMDMLTAKTARDLAVDVYGRAPTPQASN